MIDDVETLFALRPIHAADIDQHREPRMFAKKLCDLDDSTGIDFERQLAKHLCLAEHGARKRSRYILGKFIEALKHGRPQRSIMPVRRIFRCRSMMPYTRASAV